MATSADRSKWRIVVNAHVADDDERALREVHAGERRETVTYFEDTLGRPPGRSDDPLREGVKQGTTLVGSPDTVAKGIERLLGYSQGGFGGILFRAHEWADREATMRSYELFARYVMPRFQGSLDTIVGSNRWARENRKAGVRPDRGGGEEGLHRCRPRGAGGIPRPHRRRPRRRRIVSPGENRQMPAASGVLPEVSKSPGPLRGGTLGGGPLPSPRQEIGGLKGWCSFGKFTINGHYEQV